MAVVQPPKPVKKVRRKFALKITEYGMLKKDRDDLAKMHLHRRELKSLARKATEETREFFKEEIKNLKESIKSDYADKFFNVTVSSNKYKHEPEDMFVTYPRREDLITMRDELFNKIKMDRKKRRTILSSTREFNGFNYPMLDTLGQDQDTDTGLEIAPTFTELADVAIDTKDWKIPSFKGARCFSKKNTVLGLLSSEEYSQRIRRVKKPYDKSNYVGVELEFVSKMDAETLEALFVEYKLAGNVCLLHDGSLKIDPDHYEDGSKSHAHEVTIIAKQQNIHSVVERVCNILNSDDVDAYVNDSCGMHVHLDMRYRDPKVCYSNLFKSLKVLSSMIPANRVKSDHGRRYCALNTKPEFSPTGDRESRYKAINPESYKKHGTLEIRLHSGTTNINKINNWISILTAIVDKKEPAVIDVLNGDDMKSAFDISESLVEYIKVRTKKFSENEAISNKEDNFDVAS